jgi:catechol 2,3-dioxygenase-like lactoylglutathione lyase family enzyme
MTTAKQTPTSLTRGVHHVGLTVPNVAETTTFFVDVLGYKKVGERPEYPAAFVSDGSSTITLWQATDPKSAVAFDRKNVIGLHHLAIAVENRAALATLHERLRVTPNVDIEFPPEQQGTGSNNHMMCSIPGGIRVEFNAPT